MFHFSNNWIINGKLILTAHIDVREDISLKTVSFYRRKFLTLVTRQMTQPYMPLKISVLYLENKNLLNICRNNEAMKYKLL